MYSSTLLLTSALGVGGWAAPRPGRFTPRKDPVPIVQETGWAPGSVWTGAENLAQPPNRDSIPGLKQAGTVLAAVQRRHRTYFSEHSEFMCLYDFQNTQRLSSSTAVIDLSL